MNNNQKATKRALLTSVMALAMCVVMLVGTTFAWFTDTASTAVNKIQAGTLDVALEMNTGTVEQPNWVNAEGKTLGWVAADGRAQDQILWEPGCRYELPELRIVNKGNLALKYKIQITGIQGDAKLNEVIDWTINDADVNLTEGHLTAGQQGDAFTIKGHMQESAGNEYQGLSIDGIGITVLATQDTVESDSFNNQYDKDAVYGDVMVSSDAELKAAIEDPAMKVIAVNGDLTYDWGRESHKNSKALLMKGKTFLGANDAASITFAGYGSANPIVDATFRNITIKDSTVGDDEASWEHGYLEFKNLNAVNVTFADSIMLSGDNSLMNCAMNNEVTNWYGIWIEGGNTVIKNSSFSGTRSVKIHEAYGTNVESVVIDNCVFGALSEKPGVVIGTVDATTKVTIKNSTFVNCQAGDQGLYIYETDTDVTTFKFVNVNNTIATGVSNNTELKDAIAAGGEVVLIEDIKLDDRLNVVEGKEVHLDMNGKTITVESGSSVDPAFYTYKDSTLVIDGNGTVILEDPSMSLLFPGGDVVIENGTFIRKVPAGTPSNEVGALIVGAKVSPWGSQTVTINGGYFDGGYYDANAADVDEILAGTKSLVETDADIANRGKSADKNAVRVAIKNNTQLTLNLSYNLFKIHGGTFVGVNPAWGDEGCMLPATNDLYLRPWSYYQGALLDGQEYNENGIVLPDGYTITKGAAEDGRPTYTVEYNK